MKNRRRGLQRIVAITVLSLTAAALAFVWWVNRKYCFTPAAISEHGFALAREVTEADGWAVREYVSDLPFSEVKQAFVEEMKERGHEVDYVSGSKYQRISFDRAGWGKAYLESGPQVVGKTRFHIQETDEFIRRAMIVLGIRN